MNDAQGKIIAALAVTAAFTLIGEYAGKSGKKPDPTKVILGGSIAAAILIGIAEFGETGEQLALGIAVLAAVAAVLVEGGPVWDLINSYLGSKSTAALGTSTTPTAPTSK